MADTRSLRRRDVHNQPMRDVCARRSLESQVALDDWNGRTDLIAKTFGESQFSPYSRDEAQTLSPFTPILVV